MKFKNSLPKLMAILICIIGFASCEEDYDPLTTNIGIQNFDGDIYISNNLAAYSRKLYPVQTNDLPSYQLGIYDDPLYGKSTINLLSQVEMVNPNPDFGDSTDLKSVYLYIPYFASGVDTDGNVTYTLDSIYGDSPMNLSLFESNYYLRDFDPATNFEEEQRYYSNQGPLFDNYIGTPLGLIEDFVPSAEQIVVVEDDPDTEEDEEVILPPGLRIELSREFFNDKIISKENEPELLNNNNFKNYFRGINMQVNSINGQGNLFIFDISKSQITLDYTHVVSTTSDGTTTYETEDAQYLLTLGGISVNTFENDLNSSVAAALENPDTENGEETLYIRGGDGIITVIDLFNGEDQLKVLNGKLVAGENGVPDELDELRLEGWLINEANLIFYVDQSVVTGGMAEPERIEIYNLNSSRLLPDYTFDISSSTEAVDAKSEHLGRLVRGSDDNGEYYKIRITSFLSNIIKKDSTNAPLGLVVTQNVLETDFQYVQEVEAPGIKKIPAACIVSPQGTALYGNKSPNQDKKLKLQIYYTKPN